MNFSQPSRRLVSQDDAAITEQPQVPRSKFLNEWSRKTAFDAGFLVPILVDEILPGDHMSYNVTAFVRLNTPLFPLMDSQRIDTFFFFVPCRLIWDNWEKFMGAQDNPTDSIAFTIPQSTSPVNGYDVNSLHDHMGLPTVGQYAAAATLTHNNLPLRAYNLIRNEWFRDQNLQNKSVVDTDDGPDAHGDYILMLRAKAHDYFTSALPWPQKFTSVNAPLSGLGVLNAATTGPYAPLYEAAGENTAGYTYAKLINPASNDTALLVKMTAAAGGLPDVGTTIEAIRQAFQIQSLLERDARGGTRYVELLRSHFGVTNPDFRLQRPEYIGGGQTPLILTPVAQTTPAGGNTVGALGAAGTAAGSHRASYAATEHGYIIGLINVRSELSYQQGVPKLWSRSTRYDFYWPSFAGLGEQAILRKELYFTGVALDDAAIFGYQERWHEYRTRYSEVTGIMRSTAFETLDAWHLAQRFTFAPTLTNFIQDVPPMERVLAEGLLAANQTYLADLLFNRTAVRPVPTYGTPVHLGRF